MDVQSRPMTSHSAASDPHHPTSPVQAPQKFSRYRSVRKAAAAAAATAANNNGSAAVLGTGSNAPPPVPSLPTETIAADRNMAGGDKPRTENASIRRSMSRYRHAKPGATRGASAVPPPPPLPQLVTAVQNLPTTTVPATTMRAEESGKSWKQDNIVQRDGYTSPQEQEVQSPRRLRALKTEDTSYSRDSVDRPTEELSTERETTHPETNVDTTMARKRLSKPRVDIDIARANARPPRTPGDVVTSPTSPFQLRSPQLEIQRRTEDELLANKRATERHYGISNDNGAEGKMVQSAKSVKTKGGGLLSRMKVLDTSAGSKLNGNKGSLKELISSPQLIDSSQLIGGSGSSSKDNAAPADDTPISAVNAGERRVLVTCKRSFITLPITPTTQVQDLLYSAANCLSENIDVRASVLLESFKQLGLERPLRKYEHVRDVMNSWDNDSQNQLIVAPVAEYPRATDLESKTAPKKQPLDSTFYLHHSQKPGKWEKRFVTLRADGQVLVSKKEKKEGSSESTNICHVSDFDIYTPTHREARKLKPPKKVCFAVKSQQKSIMFLSTENFVHFFATNDGDVAAKFYAAVQQWRSWYLVNVMGEGSKDNEKKSGKPEAKPSSSSSKANTRGAGHQQVTSTASIPYQLGTFKPLLDMDMSRWDSDNYDSRPESPMSPVHEKQQQYIHSSPAKSTVSRKTTKTSSRRPSTARTHHIPTTTTTSPHITSTKLPPLDIDHKNIKIKSRGRSRTTTSANNNSSNTAPAVPDPSEPFSSTGLLGRTYMQRKEAQQEREKDAGASNNNNNNPFSAHGLLTKIGASEPSSPSYNHHTHLTRHAADIPSTATSSRTNTMKTTQHPDFHTNASAAFHRSKSLHQKQAKPLIDLTPIYKEPPQHARKGRGVNNLDSGKPLVEAATGPELPPGAIVIPSATTWQRKASAPAPQWSGTVVRAGSGSGPHGGGGQGPSSPRGALRQRSNTARSLHRGGGGQPPPPDLSFLHSPPLPQTTTTTPITPIAVPDGSDGPIFAPSGLLARSDRFFAGSQGSAVTGRGVATGDRYAVGRPMIDLRAESAFADGSLLRGVEEGGDGGGRPLGVGRVVIDRSKE
ncbi:hypothetical protein AJ80_09286 [Polytolypa hystricis UAMH7299]|uniref:PH domain-containing protein n=1 Tax=Polytolypa hystricis (strain UAMH7299) TaxID=1447883 RepID=A0A2B7WKA7_POLH7|nr:hypothetical protein AJ80_09286 [Polytolypa hystricis UAMH7299]